MQTNTLTRIFSLVSIVPGLYNLAGLFLVVGFSGLGGPLGAKQLGLMALFAILCVASFVMIVSLWKKAYVLKEERVIFALITLAASLLPAGLIYLASDVFGM